MNGEYQILKVRTLEDAELNVTRVPHVITVRNFKRLVAARTGMPIGEWNTMDMLFAGEELDDGMV